MNSRWLAAALLTAAASLPPVHATPPPPAVSKPAEPAVPVETRPAAGCSTCRLAIPRGANVLVNGSFAPGEWDEAWVEPLDAGHELLLKRDDRYFYLGIRFLGQRHTGLDIYLAAGGEMRALHVSSALADRRRGPEGWSEHDWRNLDWGANVIGTVAGESGPRFLEPEGFEIQLSQAAFKGRELALRIELKRPAAVFPAGTTDGDTKGWIRVQL
ncbi:MAG TPA: hypothetical protein VEG34_02175 [Thermoanaerobaculia bacterium]|nr:hypothetical protein [Thermoanaerobaculia bacterium]